MLEFKFDPVDILVIILQISPVNTQKKAALKEERSHKIRLPSNTCITSIPQIRKVRQTN